MDASASTKLIYATIEYLESKGLGAVGLFRVAANLAAVRELLLRHKLQQPIDVNACDDPHVVAAFLLQLLRDREPSPVDFNKMNAIDFPKDGSGPATTVVTALRSLFSHAAPDDITICAKLCSLVNKICQGASSGLSGVSGFPSSAAASTATSLASIIGPALCRPAGSAFMSIRHKQAVPKIRDIVKSMFLHAAPVFTNLHPTGPANTVRPSLFNTSGGSTSGVSIITKGTTSDDESGYESPPYVSNPSSRSNTATPKSLAASLKAGGAASPTSPQSPSISHKPVSYVHPAVSKAIDALLFFTVRDYVHNSASSPLPKTLLPDLLGANTAGSESDAKFDGKVDDDTTGCKNPFCPLKAKGQGAELARVIHGASVSDEWVAHDALPGLLAKPVTNGWTSQTTQIITDSADQLSSSLESVHLSAAPILSPSMSRRLDARRSRVSGGVGGVEARTPPPVDLGDVEGLEGLGVTVNSPVSETASRMRPSATSRRVQIAKCKALRNSIRDFEASFSAEHGHQPRGQERAPLRNVYLQYRRLKQGVRENAATHIQMVYRGHSVRNKYAGTLRRGSAVSASAAAGRGGPAVSEAKLDDRPESRDGDDINPTGGAVTSSTSPTSALSSGNVTLSQLRDEKSQLKQRLRAFDVEFKLKHGRMPSKSDKEVIRHLYKRYHDVKALLVGLEAASSAPIGQSLGVASSGSVMSSSGASVSSHVSAGGSVDGDHLGGDVPDSIKALQREKRVLQHHLRKFEEDFLKANGRKVKYQKDIIPVAEDYQRYKEIKTALAAYTGKQQAQ